MLPFSHFWPILNMNVYLRGTIVPKVTYIQIFALFLTFYGARLLGRTTRGAIKDFAKYY